MDVVQFAPNVNGAASMTLFSRETPNPVALPSKAVFENKTRKAASLVVYGICRKQFPATPARLRKGARVFDPLGGIEGAELVVNPETSLLADAIGLRKLRSPKNPQSVNLVTQPAMLFSRTHREATNPVA